ncbi:hypothetical protein [Agrobacterium tumefaciens]|uniref:hypothetical protein n=1 Tax=Agrobacterium tumefaciens TaxID=358 RepID=UPI0021D0B90A|nr:hypothetical protein [Agrobacterium tumefaciens]UXS66167.1 hypothetical protein FY147_24685 [Agrobacterium tumefaciens]
MRQHPIVMSRIFGNLDRFEAFAALLDKIGELSNDVVLRRSGMRRLCAITTALAQGSKYNIFKFIGSSASLPADISAFDEYP